MLIMSFYITNYGYENMSKCKVHFKPLKNSNVRNIGTLLIFSIKMVISH